jgi:hypothetical protein
MNSYENNDNPSPEKRERSQCGYFITTDRKILNKKIDGIAVLNPLAFVEEYSE